MRSRILASNLDLMVKPQKYCALLCSLADNATQCESSVLTINVLKSYYSALSFDHIHVIPICLVALVMRLPVGKRLHTGEKPYTD